METRNLRTALLAPAARVRRVADRQGPRVVDHQRPVDLAHGRPAALRHPGHRCIVDAHQAARLACQAHLDQARSVGRVDPEPGPVGVLRRRHRRIRFTGDRAKTSYYRSDVDRVQLHGTALIVSVRSELRGQKAYRSKRSRWYVLELAGGQVTSVSPASRHNVLANPDGSPFIDSLEALEALEAVAAWAQEADAPEATPEPGAPAAARAAVAPASEEAPTLRLVLVDHCPQGQLF